MTRTKKIKASDYRFERPMPIQEHHYFVNSLRQALGLEPLYATESKETPWYAEFLGDGNRRASQ